MKKLILGILFISSILLLGGNYLVKSKDWNNIREVTYGLALSDKIGCSAVKISKNELLTAAHCIVFKEFTVYDNDLVVGKAIFVRSDEKKDLALLYITEGVEGKHASVASQEGLQDTIVVGGGYPLGEFGEVLSTGFWQALVAFSEERLERSIATIPVTFGFSGGGIFKYTYSRGWELVGIISQMPGQYPGIPYNNIVICIPLDEIKEFLANKNGNGSEQTNQEEKQD